MYSHIYYVFTLCYVFPYIFCIHIILCIHVYIMYSHYIMYSYIHYVFTCIQRTQDNLIPIICTIFSTTRSDFFAKYEDYYKGGEVVGDTVYFDKEEETRQRECRQKEIAKFVDYIFFDVVLYTFLCREFVI